MTERSRCLLALEETAIFRTSKVLVIARL